MVFGATVIATRTQQRVMRRNPNLLRSACGSMKDVYLSSRLSEQQIQTLACEFTEWQVRHGVRTGLGTSNKREKLFVLYLARGGYYHQLGRAEGLSLTSMATYLHQVAELHGVSVSNECIPESKSCSMPCIYLTPDIFS